VLIVSLILSSCGVHGREQPVSVVRGCRLDRQTAQRTTRSLVRQLVSSGSEGQAHVDTFFENCLHTRLHTRAKPAQITQCNVFHVEMFEIFMFHSTGISVYMLI